jgi:hypothetical protein
MRKKISSKFDFVTVKKIKDIFIEKEWEQFEEFDYFFENFCSVTEQLDKSQTNLLLELTENFLWLRQNEYFSYLKKALLLLEGYKHLNLNKVYVVPMLSKSDREKNKTKSSKLVAYSCQNTILKYTDLFKNTTFIIIDDLKYLPKKSKLEANKNPIILVDDYIGTGDTALESLEEILEIQNYTNKSLFLVSLVTQLTGQQVINDEGFELLASVYRNKGISDNYQGKKEVELKRIMTTIEDLLIQDPRFDEDYRFGYKSSESLVSMIRTPNNTFPLYWFNADLKKGHKWKAPFPRD